MKNEGKFVISLTEDIQWLNSNPLEEDLDLK